MYVFKTSSPRSRANRRLVMALGEELAAVLAGQLVSPPRGVKYKLG